MPDSPCGWYNYRGQVKAQTSVCIKVLCLYTYGLIYQNGAHRRGATTTSLTVSSQSSPYPVHTTSLSSTLQFMLPNPKHTPSAILQSPSHQAIPFLISIQFFPPKQPIGSRLRGMLWATMPKTAIHKNCDSVFWKDEVGAAKHLGMPAPSP